MSSNESSTTTVDSISNCVTFSNDTNDSEEGINLNGVCDTDQPTSCSAVHVPTKVGRSSVGSKGESNKGGKCGDHQAWLRFELVCLAMVIFVVWGLFALPMVFYHIPVKGGVSLPDCASFPDETDLNLVGLCDDKMMGDIAKGVGSGFSGSGSASGHDIDSEIDGPQDSSGLMPSSSEMMVSTSLNNTCECNKDFLCRESNESGVEMMACVPECGSWKQYSDTSVIILNAAIILAVIIGIPSGILGLIIAVVNQKKTFAFPPVLVVYKTITMLVLTIVIAISYIDRPGLFCSSPDLLEALTTATPYCIISGVLLFYATIQLIVWWMFHIAVLFWKLQFPFHSRRFENNGRMRYLHLTAVIVGLTVPVIPIAIAMINYAVEDSKSSDSSLIGKLGFGIVNFPPYVCSGTDPEVLYYSYILPIIVSLMVGIAPLLVSFWIIHKHYGLFRVKQSKNFLMMGTAERKVLIVLCYHVIFLVISLTNFTIEIRNRHKVSSELLNIFLCERSGPSTPCSREELKKLSQPVLLSLSYIFIGLYPVVNLSYIINIRDVKQMFKRRLPRMHSQQTHVTSVSATNTVYKQPNS